GHPYLDLLTSTPPFRSASTWVPPRGTAVAPLRRSIALDLKDVSVKQALREIGRRGGIEIAYGDDVLRARARARSTSSPYAISMPPRRPISRSACLTLTSLRSSAIERRSGATAVPRGGTQVEADRKGGVDVRRSR